jgi:hypothetical protein
LVVVVVVIAVVVVSCGNEDADDGIGGNKYIHTCIYIYIMYLFHQYIYIIYIY